MAFLNKGLKFQSYVYNKYHDLLMMSLNLSNITILKTKNVDYCCTISDISKGEALILMNNIEFDRKKWSIVKIKYQMSFKI